MIFVATSTCWSLRWWLAFFRNKVKVTQLCSTLRSPMDYTVHGILQARILEWVAFPFSRGSSQPRDQTQVSHIADRFLTCWASREARILKWAAIPSPGDLPDSGNKPGSPTLQAILYQLSCEGSSLETKFYFFKLRCVCYSQVAQRVKNLSAMQETSVGFLGWENPLEKG